MWKEGSLLAIASKENCVYFLQELSSTPSALLSFPAINSKSTLHVDTQDIEVWHRRMGHLNRRYVQLLKTQADGLDIGANRKYHIDCADCIKSNQRKQISRFPMSTPKDLLDVIYADICGPMQKNDFWGHRYFALFVCAKSRYKFLYLIFKKSDVTDAFQTFKCWAEKQYTVTIKVLHTDGGREFQHKDFQQWLTSHGIVHVTTPPYSPDMNGGCEVWNRVIVQSASAMLLAANLPLAFWGQACLCAAYLSNRSPTKSLKCTPYQALHGRKPYIGHIRTWGCRAYAHIPKEAHRKKWDPHSRECILVGFYDSENVFKLYDIEANAIIKVRDVIFFEDILGHDRLRRDNNSKTLITGLLLIAYPGAPTGGSDSEHEDTVVDDYMEMVATDEDHITSLHSKWARLADASFTASHRAFLELSSVVQLIQPSPFVYDFKIPKGYKNAMRSKYAEQWRTACDLEYSALIHNRTWSLVPRTPDMSVIQHKWVFDVKLVPSSLDNPEVPMASRPLIDRFRARLVARGDSQVYAVNYDDVYAPVVRFASLRIVLHFAAMLDLDIEQGDFCNAFLNGVLDHNTDRIYMTQPEGYISDPNLVCLLHKALYGLKQSARQWYTCLHKCLTAFGMVRISTDQAIWSMRRLILLAHIDDVLMIGHSTSLRKHILSHFRFKELGPASVYTGVYIFRDRPSRCLYLDQAPYVAEILDDFGMTNSAPSAIPMDPRQSWLPSDPVKDNILDNTGKRLYQRAIGQLMYLMLATRSDIAYAVTKLAKFSACPSEHHWLGVLRILRYLRKFPSVRLCLGNKPPSLPSLPSPLPMVVGYFDASLMACTASRKSTGAYIFFLQGSCISWASKKQALIALSSTEAEFIAGTEAARELA